MDLHRRLGNRRGQGRALLGLGDVLWYLGRWREAAGHYQTALELFQQLGDRRLITDATLCLGGTFTASGQSSTAAVHFRECLETFRDLGDRRSQAETLRSLGVVYAITGRWREALDAYQEVLTLLQEGSDPRWEAVTRRGIGRVHALLGHLAEAIRWYAQALEVFERLGDRRFQALTLISIGEAHTLQGRTDQTLERAWQLFDGLGDARRRWAERAIGEAHLATRRWNDALAWLERSREGLDPDDTWEHAAVLSGMGEAYRGLNEIAEALDYHQRCLELLAHSEDAVATPRTLQRLGLSRSHRRPAPYARPGSPRSRRATRLGQRHSPLPDPRWPARGRHSPDR
jgi:tetratricopeptide (TPR) repeat protein